VGIHALFRSRHAELVSAYMPYHQHQCINNTLQSHHSLHFAQVPAPAKRLILYGQNESKPPGRSKRPAYLPMTACLFGLCRTHSTSFRSNSFRAQATKQSWANQSLCIPGFPRITPYSVEVSIHCRLVSALAIAPSR